jgi:hypothetical protein
MREFYILALKYQVIGLYYLCMRFLISVIATKTSPAHTPEEIKAIDDFNDKIEDAGQRLFACGMESPDNAFVFDYRTGKSEVIPGPLHATTEYASGFWIVKVDSLETAKQLAAEGSAACNRKTGLRPLHG